MHLINVLKYNAYVKAGRKNKRYRKVQTPWVSNILTPHEYTWNNKTNSSIPQMRREEALPAATRRTADCLARDAFGAGQGGQASKHHAEPPRERKATLHGPLISVQL